MIHSNKHKLYFNILRTNTYNNNKNIINHFNTMISRLMKHGKKIKHFNIYCKMLCIIKNTVKHQYYKCKSTMLLIQTIVYKIRPNVRFITFYRSGKKYVLPFYSQRRIRSSLGIR